MTREDLIKKISDIFTSDNLYSFVSDCVSGCEYDIEEAQEIKATFINTFREEIEQIADMVR